MNDFSDLYLTPYQVAEKLQVAVETVYRWLRSGKLRGARISQKAWRIAERDLDSLLKKQNVSELLFEEYIAQQDLGQPEREPLVPGRAKRVDYRLPFKGHVLWFEVKEFADDPSALEGGFGAYDPYVGIRRKIGKAGDKFRDYRGECCSLVLFNRGVNLVDICTPQLVLGAMMGNVGFRIPIDFESGTEAGPVNTVFTEGGKLRHPHTNAPQSTTISAVMALERLAVGQREFRIKVATREIEEQRNLSPQEFHEFFLNESNDYDRKALRSIVYENPHAAKPLPPDLFKGPFDERWGRDADFIKRIYVGQELAKLEASEHALELDLGPVQKIIKRQQNPSPKPAVQPEMPAATVRVLVRNLESDTSRLQFSSFSIEELFDVRRWEAALKFFPNAGRDEWLLERHYVKIPPIKEDWSGYGAIPFDVEDMLLLLRLYRPGDLAFIGVHVTTPQNSGKQFPYRAISDLVGNSSRRPFKFTQADCSAWEQFEAPLRTSLQWKSAWFDVSRRFLLYGGGKEFNPNFQGDVDRVIDYMTALEAAIVPESDFVSRRLRERSARLLELQEDAALSVKKLLSDMYGIRSTLVHGSPLDHGQMALLQEREQWMRFEQLVRDVLVNALRKVPDDEPGRRLHLARLYDVSDTDHAEKLLQDFKAIKNERIKQDLLRAFLPNTS